MAGGALAPAIASIVCLGDAIGYLAEAKETAELHKWARTFRYFGTRDGLEYRSIVDAMQKEAAIKAALAAINFGLGAADAALSVKGAVASYRHARAVDWGTSALRARAGMPMPETSQVLSFAKVEELTTTLRQHGVPVETWGSGGSKSIASLFKEVEEGTSRLVVIDGTQLVRETRVSAVHYYASVDGQRLVLREAVQVFLNPSQNFMADDAIRFAENAAQTFRYDSTGKLLEDTSGRFVADGTGNLVYQDDVVRARVRGAMGWSASEKVELGEDAADAAMRIGTEEFGFVAPPKLTNPVELKQLAFSNSYPGLGTRQVRFEFDADIIGSNFKTTYVEVQAAGSDPKITLWHWVGLD